MSEADSSRQHMMGVYVCVYATLLTLHQINIIWIISHNRLLWFIWGVYVYVCAFMYMCMCIYVYRDWTWPKTRMSRHRLPPPHTSLHWRSHTHSRALTYHQVFKSNSLAISPPPTTLTANWCSFCSSTIVWSSPAISRKWSIACISIYCQGE